ncbi:20677_t:CDS:2 [Funneliformis geosporum]|uniref:14290_t:CDS:1 n=1 Tax=Funneliformis geosporum TaxID=1117311 RepID=A0A9W4SE45_9GLOM|nr:14290_t:CDS:2 [Funneliformis geosporum]CAI2168580.1 20677_t:CDS:2 [Funneliformis geosporum]
MVKNPGVRKQREESLINWMWLSSNPTPLSFFRYTDAVDRSRSINKYSSIITKAINRNTNITISDKLNNVLDKFNKGEYKNDWEDWKKERTKSVTVTNIVETNFDVHNEYNSTFNTPTFGKRNSKDSSKKSARRKTKRVKLPDDDEELDDNEDSSESQSTDENPTNGSETSPPRSSNKEKLLSTPNKRNMHDVEIVRYLDAMENCLKHNRILSDAPPVWTKPLEAYLDNAFKKESDEFKMSIVQEIREDKGNHFRLYCEKILMDFYNLVDIFPDMSRRIGKRKYIVQNISSLFKFYETTFGKICIDWIESHSPSGKLTKSTTNFGIVKVDIKDDTKKSLHTDILNLISILLDHLDLSVEVATRIKVFSFQVIEYRITFYSLNMLNDGSFLASELGSALFPFSFDARAKYKQILFLMGIFHKEVMNQISLIQELDLKVDHYKGKSVRSVLKIPMALKELLQKKFED